MLLTVSLLMVFCATGTVVNDTPMTDSTPAPHMKLALLAPHQDKGRSPVTCGGARASAGVYRHFGLRCHICDHVYADVVRKHMLECRANRTCWQHCPFAQPGTEGHGTWYFEELISRCSTDEMMVKECTWKKVMMPVTMRAAWTR
jgi:hypothetical protein